MKNGTGSTTGWRWLGVLGVVLLAEVTLLPTCADAQSEGNNAVYYYVSTTNTGQCCKGSPAFIDASVFGGTTKDICTVLYNILSGGTGITYPSTGAVIDARGLPGVGTSMTCTTSPWGSGSSYVNKPSTILLPATAGTTPAPIVIPTPWILPNNTRLIGQGDGIPTSGTAPLTTIQATSSFSGNMIQFGSSACPSPACSGISVENLTLDGQGGSINGIVNQSSQDFSYVDHVSLYQIRGTGLSVSGSANNSGPYSNITFDTGGYSGVSSTVCAQILSVSGGTHGIHGLSCTSASNDANAAVLLDSSNNSLEDVRIVGFYDGIRVGTNANAQSNVLINIIGDTALAQHPTPIIVVHITNLGNTVTDLSIMGANNAGGNPGTITIQDDSFSPSTQLTDTSVAMYALGEKDSATGAYSRYTTSPSAATWAVGSIVPSGTCARGSLYSCIGGKTSCTKTGTVTAYALWDCLSGSVWTGVM